MLRTQYVIAMMMITMVINEVDECHKRAFPNEKILGLFTYTTNVKCLDFALIRGLKLESATLF